MGNRIFNNNNKSTSNTTEVRPLNNYSNSESKPKTMDVLDNEGNNDDHNLLTDTDNNEIFSQDGEPMNESCCPINVNEVDKLVDFEDMIDSLRENEAEKTLSNIKEFENVLESFDTVGHNNEDIIDLDEIYDYLELGIENDDINLKEAQIVDADEVDNLKSEDNSLGLSISDVTINENENFSKSREGSIPKYNIDDNKQKTQSNDSCVDVDNIQKAVSVVKLTNDSNENSEFPAKLAADVTVLNTDGSSIEVSKDDNENVQDVYNKTITTHRAVDNTENSERNTEDIDNNDINIEDLNEKSKVNVDTVNNDATQLNSPLKEKLNAKVSEVDIIILSSDDEMEPHIEPDENDGYHSSDFEFITEEEANMDGFIINFRRKDSNNSNLNDDIDENNNNANDNSQRSEENINLENSPDNNLRNYRENHVIPEGDDYLNLFQGPLIPVMPLMDIIIMENKSIRPSPMNVQYEGMGFDNQLIARRHRRDSAEEEYADEAKENIKMILSLYPDENRGVRKRRRRH